MLFRSEYGVPPTVREIASALQIKSTSTVHKYLTELEYAGFITKKEGLNRAIQLSDEFLAISGKKGIPLLGVVTAGAPILAYEDVQDYLDMEIDGYATEDLFALRVRGESMINAGIFNGDVIIVRKTPAANNGEIVVAMIENEATVKRFYKENGHFRLQPENDSMEPIIVEDVTILGRVIRLVREYR